MYNYNPFDDENNKRDSRRSFTKSQQKKIFDRQKGRCALCGERLELSSTHYHHKVPWSEGGKTTVKNGIAVCAKCHAKLHIDENVRKIEKKAKKTTSNPFDIRLPNIKMPMGKGGFRLF